MLPQHSDVQTSKHPDLSPSVRFSPPPLLELEYHLFSSVVSFSISFYDLVASPLYLLLLLLFAVSLPLPLSLPFAQTIPKRLCRRLMPMLACAAGNNDLPSSPSLPYLYLFLSLSPPISVYILLSGWIPWIQMYIQRHTDGGEKEIEVEGKRGRGERRAGAFCAQRPLEVIPLLDEQPR